MDMDFNVDLFIYAIEKDKENKLWELWKLQYPQMDKENYISFEEYKNKNIKKQTSNKTYEEIEKEMEEVEKAFGRR